MPPGRMEGSMIVVTARMYPSDGSPSYEILNATITNRSAPGDVAQSYMTHVLMRPDRYSGAPGYEADVETQGYLDRHGFAALLRSAIGVSDGNIGQSTCGTDMPTSRVLNRLAIHFVDEFERRKRRST